MLDLIGPPSPREQGSRLAARTTEPGATIEAGFAFWLSYRSSWPYAGFLMLTGQLQRQVERHKNKDAEKAAVAIAILFGLSIALSLIGAKLGSRSNSLHGSAIASQTRTPQIAPHD